MTIGIVSAWIVIKKWVYSCPPGARCPSSFNPDNSFLQDIRTVMQYWLHAGMLIAGVGLVKLVGYQSWSVMRQRGNTIDILDLNIGALKGSAYDAANLLLLGRRNRLLGVFVLIHVAIIAAISLIVGKSISIVTDTGSVELLFDYPMSINILTVPGRNLPYSLGGIMYTATQNWLTSHAANLTLNETFSGTFVIQDSRGEYGVNARPSGQQIGGSVSCIDPSTYIVSVSTSTVYLITYPGSLLLKLDILQADLDSGGLIGQFVNGSSSGSVQNYTFLWYTIADGVIPNAMEVPAGAINASNMETTSMFIGLCEHSITFSNLSQNDTSVDGMQYINPSQPTLYLPPGGLASTVQWGSMSPINLTRENPAICDESCMLMAVWETLLQWWILGLPEGTSVGQADIYCYGGVLAPAPLALASLAPVDDYETCPSLDGEIWNKTLALALDAIIQTYPRVGNASQKLFAQQELIGRWHWWLQGIIPVSAFILYLACLAYTIAVYCTGETMKELDLLEVINASTRAHTEEEILTKSAMVGGESGDLKEQVG